MLVVAGAIADVVNVFVATNADVVTAATVDVLVDTTVDVVICATTGVIEELPDTVDIVDEVDGISITDVQLRYVCCINCPGSTSLEE